MDKLTFLEMLNTNRAELDSALAQVDAARVLEAGVSGEMSVKDILAHVNWYEREMVGVLTHRALSGSDLWVLSHGDRNMAILDQNRARALDEVRQEFRQIHEALVKALEDVDEVALIDAGWFRDMPAEWIPWQLIADNSCDHYLQHAADIRHWVAGR